MEFDQKEYQSVILAALLHDVGKFMQRANKYLCNEGDQTNNRCNLTDCDGKKKGADYRHSCHSYWFIKNNKNVFGEEFTDGIARLVLRHHEKTKDPLEAIVRMADHFSAGCDRTVKQVTVSHYFKRQPLRSIFDKITVSRQSSTKNEKENFHRIAVLSPESSIPSELKEKVSKEDYLRLWEKQWDGLYSGFLSDIRKLQDLPFKRFVPALNTILEQYTWCVPSSTWKDEPDISLYDHLVTSAALATAMYCYYLETYGSNFDAWDIRRIDSWDEECFLFVAGDLSGIQDYLFDLKLGKYSAKVLRARSFELQMLAETAIKDILEKAELPPICRIMNAAGRFILVLPNIEKSRKAIRKAREEIEMFCRDRYLGQLTINISHGFAASGRFLRQETALDSFFPRIANDIERAKQKKFQAILSNQNAFFIQNNYDEFKNNQDLCPVCGKRPVTSTAKDKEDEDLCRPCRQLIDTGRNLTDANYLSDVPIADEACLRLFGETNLSLRKTKPNQYKWICTMNEYQPGFPLVYGGVHVPMIEESHRVNGKDYIRKRIKSFEELADQAQGDDRVAMLKADVDDLGSIFSIGLGKKVSLSRFATLSRMINYFFTRYVFKLVESDDRFRDSIYTVFSGGDDLCVVGPWDKIIVFANEINQNFFSFVGRLGNITLSSGITVSKPNLPTHRMFTEADELLNLSKSDAKGKNRVTLFGTTVTWEQFAVLLQVARKLEEYLKPSSGEDKQREVGKGIFQRLLQYGEKAKCLEKKEDIIRPRDALWISQFYYDVTRNVRSETDEFKILCLEHIKEIRLPVSYVLYKNRERG
ncbi:MAG: type III-A CRISPR-associated protein Cas10/Csm1 [Deltaproteobacteria bacterium]|nr:type III-A CRISPR-associated protein Cas10/Csm1 [Deltaproteobacteria bacterium]